MSTELEQVTQAVAEFDRVGAGIKALQEKYSGVLYDVTTTAGMKDAKAARAAVREPRFEVERIRKDAKAPILALGKKLDTEAKRITEELLKIEEPIQLQIETEEQRKETEKQAAIAAEMKRVSDLQERIAELRGCPNLSPTSGSVLISDHIQDLEEIIVDDSFQEFRQQAEDAKAAGLSRLRDLHAAALAHEVEQERIRVEREELARLRAEQAEREALERARLVEEERRAREIRDREEAEARERRAAEEAEFRRQREEIEAQRQAERERIAEEERQARIARLAEEQRLSAERARMEREQRENRERQEIEERRLADERANFERQQREAREAEERRAAEERAHQERRRLMENRSRPDSEAIVGTVAAAFEVDSDIAAGWIYETPKQAWKNLAKRSEAA